MNQSLGNLNTIADARQRLGGIGNTTIYDWIKTGRVRAIKLGARTFIADAEIDRILHEANQAAAEKAAARRERGAA
ncbi:helix-turn-helix domain-containing protein [Bosea vestrisii]|uniref:Helix-turn-helix domain-containing protein n=1 Tax=Bosea vestrisii TaxID=151416 RepID=A0ABW0H7J2_9HYPH